jgi:hypothetical protein
MPRGHDIWLRLTEDGGAAVTVDPSTMTSSSVGSFGPVDWEEYRGDLGALWWYDWPTGAVDRQGGAGEPIRTIRVTQFPPQSGGPCLTSMTVGSGSLWVTAAPGTPFGGVCIR